MYMCESVGGYAHVDTMPSKARGLAYPKSWSRTQMVVSQGLSEGTQTQILCESSKSS